MKADVSVNIYVDVHYVYTGKKVTILSKHCYYCGPVPDKQTPIEYGMVE